MNAKTHDAQNIKKLLMEIINFSFALSSNRTWKGTLTGAALQQKAGVRVIDVIPCYSLKCNCATEHTNFYRWGKQVSVLDPPSGCRLPRAKNVDLLTPFLLKGTRLI